MDDQQIEREIETLRGFDSELAVFEEGANRSTFDIERLAVELGSAEEAVEFVTKEIGFEPYQGVLRGARGALESRAGNHVDRALLLASLLNELGFEIRLVTARLSQDQASLLASESKETPHVTYSSTVEALPDLRGQKPKALSELSEGIHQTDSARPEPISDDFSDGQIADSAQYVFVEVQDGTDWQPKHTLEVEVDGPTSVLTPDDLEELRHGIEIKLVNGVATEVGAEETVMLEFVTDAANAFGKGIELVNAHIPDEEEAEARQLVSIEEMLANSRSFGPLLRFGDEIVHGRQFAVGATESRLVWQRLEMKVSRPDGSFTVHTRFPYRASRDGDSDTAIVRQLLGRNALAVMGGSPDPTRVALDVAAVARWMADALDPSPSLGSGLSGAIAGPDDGTEAPTIPTAEEQLEALQGSDPPSSDLDSFFLLSDMTSREATYRHQPALVLLRTWQSDQSELTRSLDIFANPRRSVPGNRDVDLVMAGVVDAYLEACLMGTGGQDGSESVSAIGVIEAGTPLGRLTSVDSLPSLEPTKAEFSAMAQDLANGAQLEVFREPNSGQLSWWASRPSDGSVIARNEHGGHAAGLLDLPLASTSEYGWVVSAVGVALTFGMVPVCFVTSDLPDPASKTWRCSMEAASSLFLALVIGSLVAEGVVAAAVGLIVAPILLLIWLLLDSTVLH